MYANRNYAAVIVGDGQVSVMRGAVNSEARTTYSWLVRNNQGQHAGSDLHTGVGMDKGPVAMLGTMLSLLGAAAESYAWSMRNNGEPGENSALFPAAVNAWAYMWGDEITMLQLEIEQPEQAEAGS